MKILIPFVLIFSLNTVCFAYQQQYPQNRKNIMYDQRLNLTTQQKQYLEQRRPTQIREMQNTVGKMQNVHDRIKDVYQDQSIPRYQAEIKTAPMKAELAILKQNADRQKEQNRKDFESILTKEQRAEFERIRQEQYMRNRQRY